jgi:hypothetical protein
MKHHQKYMYSFSRGAHNSTWVCDILFKGSSKAIEKSVYLAASFEAAKATHNKNKK